MFKEPKILLFVVILLTSILFVNAVSLEVKYDPIKNNIKLEEEATFNINVFNKEARKDTFRLYTLDYPIWEVHTEPRITPILVDVEPNSNKSIKIYVNPLHITLPGGYIVNLNVKSQKSGDFVKVPLTVKIKSTAQLIGGYIPTVLVNAKIPDKIDPRQDIPISVDLDNQNPLNYSELRIIIDSKLIKKTLTEKLGPNEQKTVTITERIDPSTKPQKDKITVTVLYGNRTISGPLKKQIEISSYSELKKDVKTTKKFLKTSSIVTLTNDGNIAYSGRERIETTSFKNLFLSSKPRSKTIKDEGKKYIAWDISLKPNETQTIELTENYRPLFVIFILLIIVVILYYVYRSPLVITKAVSNIEKTEGGVSGLKLIITVSNRSKNQIRHIEVIDKIPHIAQLDKGISIGTLPPHKILKHEKKGTIVKWMIDELDPNDQRVINYKAKSRLAILGEFNLPAAAAKFRYNNKQRVTSSNKLRISS
jgi:hypothetical protein